MECGNICQEIYEERQSAFNKADKKSEAILSDALEHGKMCIAFRQLFISHYSDILSGSSNAHKSKTIDISTCKESDITSALEDLSAADSNTIEFDKLENSFKSILECKFCIARVYTNMIAEPVDKLPLMKMAIDA